MNKQAAELAKKYRKITPALKLKDDQIQDSFLPEFARYLKGYLFDPESRDVVTNWQNQKNSQNVLPKLQEFGVSLESAQTVIDNLQKTTLPELAKSLQEKVDGYSLSKAELETVLPDKQTDLKKQRIFEQMVLSLLQSED